jgi:hypothetical protein
MANEVDRALKDRLQALAILNARPWVLVLNDQVGVGDVQL